MDQALSFQTQSILANRPAAPILFIEAATGWAREKDWITHGNLVAAPSPTRIICRILTAAFIHMRRLSAVLSKAHPVARRRRLNGFDGATHS